MPLLSQLYIAIVILFFMPLAGAEDVSSALSEGIKRIETAPQAVIAEYTTKLEDLQKIVPVATTELATTHYILSRAYYSKNLAEKSVEHANLALELLEQNKEGLLYNKVLVAASIAYELTGQAKTAKLMAEVAHAWSVSHNDDVLKQEALVAIGLSDLTLGAYDAALDSFNQAYYLSKQSDQMMPQGHIAYHIALVYEFTKNQLEAIKFFDQAMQYYKNSNDILSYSGAIYGLARAHKFNNNTEKALELFEESLAISVELNDLQGQAYTYKELSSLYLDLQLTEKGHLSLVKALQIFAQSNNPYMLSDVNKQLAQFAKAQNQIPHATRLVNIALEYAQGDYLKPAFIELHKLKSQLQADQDDYKNAYESLLISYTEKAKYDSILNKETYERLRAEFDLVEKEDENRLLASENAQVNLKLEAQREHKIVLGLLVVLLFTIATAILFLYRQSKKAQAKLALLANTDSLTKLANRRTAFNSLALQIKLAKREGYALSLALIDLDYFKKINDELGHPVGDKALQVFARLAQEQFRTSDIVARIGGEEFLFIFPFTNIEQAQVLIIDFTDKIKEEHELHDLLGKELTCSVGLICATDYDDEISAITAADRVMYTAKNIGRDAIMCESLSPNDSK